MPFDPATYDDQHELASYIRDNYHHLLTPLEALAERAIMAESKARNTSSEGMAHFLREQWGAAGNPEVVPMLADGPIAFRARVTSRILTECARELFINRCPKCDSVVATPRAKQCLWCGHDWH